MQACAMQGRPQQENNLYQYEYYYLLGCVPGILHTDMSISDESAGFIFMQMEAVGSSANSVTMKINVICNVMLCCLIDNYYSFWRNLLSSI